VTTPLVWSHVRQNRLPVLTPSTVLEEFSDLLPIKILLFLQSFSYVDDRVRLVIVLFANAQLIDCLRPQAS
jgi:hypothetical protein